MQAGLPAMLEAEFRQLSQDARKSEGLASFFSSADHPEVKEAAERAVLKIRSVADAPDVLEQLRGAKVRPRRGLWAGRTGSICCSGVCRALHRAVHLYEAKPPAPANKPSLLDRLLATRCTGAGQAAAAGLRHQVGQAGDARALHSPEDAGQLGAVAGGGGSGWGHAHQGALGVA